MINKIKYQFVDKSNDFIPPVPEDVKNLLKKENVMFLGEFNITTANITSPGQNLSTLQCAIYTDADGAIGGYHIRNLKWNNITETTGQIGNNYIQSSFVEESYHITSYFNVDYTKKLGEIHFQSCMPQRYHNDANNEVDAGADMSNTITHTESYLVLGASGIYENVTKVIIFFEENNPIRTVYFCGRPYITYFTDTVSGR